MTVQHVTITGAVQGVAFRNNCLKAALDHGVRGWVRNQGDGSVEALLAGDAASVESMVTWCRTGPQHARVDHVEVREVRSEEFGELPGGFEVR